MRLQNKNYGFKLPSGDNPISKLLTSNVVVNNKQTDILLSELFYGIKKERGNIVKGYSVLEFVENNEIKINDKIYTLSFVGREDSFTLASITDPVDFILNDKEINDSEIAQLEKRIEESAPVEQQEQPLDVKTNGETDSAGALLFENEDYNRERDDLEQDGFVEYNTSPVSNMKLLVNEAALPETDDDEYEKITLIEIQRDDFAILIRDEYEIELNEKDKTFTYKQKQQQQ